MLTGLIIMFVGTAFLVFFGLCTRFLKCGVEIEERMAVMGARKNKERKNIASKNNTKAKMSFKMFSGKSFMESLENEMYVAGINLKSSEFLYIWWGGGLVLPLVLKFLGFSTAQVLGVAITGANIPILFVKLKRSAMVKKFDSQLVDALSIICNSLRAGFSFQTATENIAREMPDPIAREFRRVGQECKFGISLEDSLKGLVERTGNQDLELITSAVLIQKQVGGNLAEVLDNISATIKDRIKLRGDIKVLTASGTMSGYVIGGLPIFLLIALMILNPSYIEGFFSSEVGRKLLMVAAGLEIVGFIFVKKIITIKF